MNTTRNKIFEYTEHLTDEQLRGYVDSVLSAAEMHAVEKHCADCEMCNDALEGLLMLKEQGKLPALINSINKSVAEKLQPKAKVFYLDTRMRVAIAAGFALLIVVVFFFNNQLKENQVTVSDNKKVSEENASPEKQKDLPKQDILTANDNGGGPKNSPQEEGPKFSSEGVNRMNNTESQKPQGFTKEQEEYKAELSNVQEEVKSAPVPITNGEDAELNETEVDKNVLNDETRKEDIVSKTQSNGGAPKKDSKKENKKSKSYKLIEQEKAPSASAPVDDNDGIVLKQVSDSAKGGSFGGYYDNAPNSNETTTKQPVVSDSKNTTTGTTVGNSNTSAVTSNLGEAFVKFSQQKYADAAELYKQVLVTEPNNYEAMFYLEQCYYQLKKYTDAATYANKIIADGKSVYVEGAKYYLAMGLIAQGKNEEAKKYLEQVKQKNASYKTEADVQLEKMK
jgi:tetratricopeptide (TPR) repeat protein